MALPNVYIVLVNWNSWRDTLECLESLFRLDYPRVQVVVCDNGSSDGSLERIEDWASGRERAPCGLAAMREYSSPPIGKPVSSVRLSRITAESPDLSGENPSLVLIECGTNLGFAAGNNIGLRYGLARGDLDYAWLVNNDTVVAPDALSRLVERIQQSPTAGICGSTLLYYGAPDVVQAMGGASYNKWIGRARHIGIGAPKADIDNANTRAVEGMMDYVVGASMLVSRRFLDEIGLMCEDYFLYFEELDWARRAGRRFSMVYAPLSLVFHKVAASTGKGRQSAFSLGLLYRNRILVGKKYFPRYALFHRGALVFEMIKSMLKGDAQRAALIREAIKRYA